LEYHQLYHWLLKDHLMINLSFLKIGFKYKM
jgi:hypothetical protein